MKVKKHICREARVLVKAFKYVLNPVWYLRKEFEISIKKDPNFLFWDFDLKIELQKHCQKETKE